MEDKLKKHYGDEICIIYGQSKKGKIIYSSATTMEEAVSRQSSISHDNKTKIRDVALLLREEIKQSEHQPLPSNIKIEDILKGFRGKNTS